eukprot:COSAG03_NODE_8452_length_801_cov_6.733618_1_plen_64_part_10
MAALLAATSVVARSLEACVASAFGPLGCDRFVRSLQKPGEVPILSLPPSLSLPLPPSLSLSPSP